MWGNFLQAEDGRKKAAVNGTRVINIIIIKKAAEASLFLSSCFINSSLCFFF